MSLSAPASWSKSQNPYRTAPARRPRRHLVSLRDIRWQSPSAGAGGPPSPPAVLQHQRTLPVIETPASRRSRQLAAIDPKYVSQSGLCLTSDRETSRGSVRIQHLATPPPAGQPRFPKLQECAHFHYETVDLGPILVQPHDAESRCGWRGSDTSDDLTSSGSSSCSRQLQLQVTSHGRSWVLRRSYASLRQLDTQLHRCVYDRKYSCLPELPESTDAGEEAEERALEPLVADYLQRFSQIAGPLINCAPVLNWLELDNRGNRLLVADDSDINTPAVAAALVRKRYAAQASDEVNLEVGDMISVIDMAPAEESIWWRGKRGFEVGFFPSECVQLIGEKGPPPHPPLLPHPPPASVATQPIRPVLRKHGKVIAFFRNFILTRPSRRKLKTAGILKERVFGCDLGEHLLNSGRDIPEVLRSCAEFVETHGIVDGIYRLSGVNSNIQRLRNIFDEDRVPDLSEPAVKRDIHSVSCLLKQYLRELPNPLLTYQLHDKFVAAVQSGDDQRLLRMRDVVRQLPPPHYRTLEYLVRHLARVSQHGHSTGMTPKNLAIVWAPNLVRSKELEVGGVAALQGVGVQAVVVEYLIRYCDLLFSDKLPAFHSEGGGPTRTPKRSRPKSLAISTPTKLLSLEEARSRALGTSAKAEQNYIEVGGGPSALPPKYHTVIELPQRKSGSLKFGRSPLGWRSLFRGRPAKPHQRKGSEPIDIALTDKTLTESDLTQSGVKVRRLRSVKSADSLVSLCQMENKRDSRRSGLDTQQSTSPTVTCQRSASESDSAATEPVRAHGRSVSHDSYFQNLLQLKLPYCDDRLEEEEEEMNTQYCFDDSDMRVFSEDETMRATTESSGGRALLRRLASPPRPRRASRGDDAAAGKRTGSSRERAWVSPGGRRRSSEPSPRVKIRRRASSETLTCSESTSIDVSSLRTDGSGAASGEPTPPAHGCQVTADVHISPEPSTGADIGLLSPISEGAAAAADVTEGDVSELGGSCSGVVTPIAADAEPPPSRISALVPEALELLDRRLNSEQFRQAVAADAQRLASEAETRLANASALVWSGDEAGDVPDWHETGKDTAGSDYVRRSPRVATHHRQLDRREYNVAVDMPDWVAGEVASSTAAFTNARRSAADLETPAPSGAGSSPTRSCPAFSDGETPSPLAVRYSLLSSTLATPEFDLSPLYDSSLEVSFAAATCSDTVNDRPLPSEAEQGQSETSFPDNSPVEASSTLLISECSDRIGEPPVATLVDVGVESTSSLDFIQENQTPARLPATGDVFGGNSDDIAVASCNYQSRELTAPTPESLTFGSAGSSESEDVGKQTDMRRVVGGSRKENFDVTRPDVTADEPNLVEKLESPAIGVCPGAPEVGASSPAAEEDVFMFTDESSLHHRTITGQENALPLNRSSSDANRSDVGDSSDVHRRSSHEQDIAVEESPSQKEEFISSNVDSHFCRLSSDDVARVFSPDILSPPVREAAVNVITMCSPVTNKSIEARFADAARSECKDLVADVTLPRLELSKSASPRADIPCEEAVHSESPPGASPVEEGTRFSARALVADTAARVGVTTAAAGCGAETRRTASSPGVDMSGEPAMSSPGIDISGEPAMSSLGVDISGEPAMSSPGAGISGEPAMSSPGVDISGEPAMSSPDAGMSGEPAMSSSGVDISGEPAMSSSGVDVSGEPAMSSPGVDISEEPAAVQCTELPRSVSPQPRPVVSQTTGVPETVRRGADSVSTPTVPGRKRTAPVAVPVSEARGGGGRSAASWPQPAVSTTAGDARPADPPAWLRCDLRRLSDRRASVKQLLSKFEVKEAEAGLAGVEEPQATPAATQLHAPVPAPRRLVPAASVSVGAETVTTLLSPDRPRCLFTPRPFQRQLSDQATTLRPLSDQTTTVRPFSDQATTLRPLSDHAAPVRTFSDQPAPVHITNNPLHFAHSTKVTTTTSQERPLSQGSTPRLGYSPFGLGSPLQSPSNTASSASEPSTPSMASPPSVIYPLSTADIRAPVSPPSVARRVRSSVAERAFPVDASPIGVVPSRLQADDAVRSSEVAPLVTDGTQTSAVRGGSSQGEGVRAGAEAAPARAGDGGWQGVRAGAEAAPARPGDGGWQGVSAGAEAASARAGDGGRQSSPTDEDDDYYSSAERKLALTLDPLSRERIERYKRERRSLLREKYKTESFKRERSEVLVGRRVEGDTAGVRAGSGSPPPVFRRTASLRSPTSQTAADSAPARSPTKETAPLLARSPTKEHSPLVTRSPSKETGPVLSRSPVKETTPLLAQSPTREGSSLLPGSSAKDPVPVLRACPAPCPRAPAKDSPVSLRWPTKESSQLRSCTGRPTPDRVPVAPSRSAVHRVSDVDARLAAARQRLSELRALSSSPGGGAALPLSPEQQCDVTTPRGTNHVSTV